MAKAALIQYCRCWRRFDLFEILRLYCEDVRVKMAAAWLGRLGSKEQDWLLQAVTSMKESNE